MQFVAHTPSTAMQRPTLQNVRVRSTRDALHIFHGVATNRLPLITRRLDAEERRAIVPGNVYESDLFRGRSVVPIANPLDWAWKDGRMEWDGVPAEFLFYHQKESDTSDEFLNPVTPWIQTMRRREQSYSRFPGAAYSSSHRSESERLIKQTYSVHVSLPADRAHGIVRKWHLTAYFSQQKLDALDTIDQISGIGDVEIPEGWFRSARTQGKGQRSSRNSSTTTQISLDNASRTPPYDADMKSPSPPALSDLCLNSSPDHRNTLSPASLNATLAPSPATGNAAIHSGHASPRGQLVPLEYLQNATGARRNPVDEQILQRLSTGRMYGPARGQRF